MNDECELQLKQHCIHKMLRTPISTTWMHLELDLSRQVPVCGNLKCSAVLQEMASNQCVDGPPRAWRHVAKEKNSRSNQL